MSNLSRQVRRHQERKGRAAPAKTKPAAYKGERLVAAALIRDGVTQSRGFKEHWRIREALGDEEPSKKNSVDEYGFLTSIGRFVNRDEAMEIGAAAGQCQPMNRELLSSDINWDAGQ